MPHKPPKMLYNDDGVRLALPPYRLRPAADCAFIAQRINSSLHRADTSERKGMVALRNECLKTLFLHSRPGVAFVITWNGDLLITDDVAAVEFMLQLEDHLEGE